MAHRVFAGNRADVSTVEEIVEAIEEQYGAADRIWVMDRGMVSEAHVAFLKEQGRRYILGTPKSQLRRFAQHFLEQGWETVRAIGRTGPPQREQPLAVESRYTSVLRRQ